MSFPRPAPDGAQAMIYLDFNATAPLLEPARAAIVASLDQSGNASSVHRVGRRARARIEDAREQVARLVGAEPSGVVFTASGTEANVMALAGLQGRPILTGASEHDSVLRSAKAATRIPVDGDGLIDMARFEALLARHPGALVSVMLANNETGVIQDIGAISSRVHRADGLLHCDASQAPGRVPVDLAALGCDWLTLSAHKIGGPLGAAALVMTSDAPPPRALLVGGGQERGLRAGTENVPAIAGFGATCAALAEMPPMDPGRRDRLIAALRAHKSEIVVFGELAPRLPNTVCFAVPGWPAERQLMALDLAGIAVSSGSACSSGKVKPSHVLGSMGVAEDLSRCAIRVSFGRETSDTDLARFAEIWVDLADRALVRN